MIITFVGHSSLYKKSELSGILKKTIMDRIACKEPVSFYCGGYGDFDTLCAKVCHFIKQERNDCEIVFITPYITESQQGKINYLIKNNVYDSVIYPPLEKIPFKFAIRKRNEWMVDQADLVIAYVEYTSGGAYKTLCYAQKRKKHIINLAK